MAGFKKNILITGLPGTGKTTLIIKLSEQLKQLSLSGFYTSEIREQGVRKGFEIQSLDGRKGLLSHVDIRSPYRVGKYRVDIVGFEKFLDSLDLMSGKSRLIIIDEIGKMECLSLKFKQILMSLLDSEKAVIATIALKGGGIISQIKRRDDVILYKISEANRLSLLSDILNNFSKRFCS